jgi:hypothetical protein
VTTISSGPSIYKDFILYEQDYLYPICREFFARHGAKDLVHQLDRWVYQSCQLHSQIVYDLSSIEPIVQELQAIWDTQVPPSTCPTVAQLKTALQVREHLKCQKLYPLLLAETSAQILQ